MKLRERFSKAYQSQSNKEARAQLLIELWPLLRCDEFIPGELLLSRAHFRFNSTVQKSITKSIF